MLAEWEKLAREAAVRNEPYDAYLLQLTELEVAARSANAVTAALLDRLTHKGHIFEMNGESYRFRESMKTKKEPAPKKGK
jgi:DNA replication protein DnaC